MSGNIIIGIIFNVLSVLFLIIGICGIFSFRKGEESETSIIKAITVLILMMMICFSQIPFIMDYVEKRETQQIEIQLVQEETYIFAQKDNDLKDNNKLNELILSHNNLIIEIRTDKEIKGIWSQYYYLDIDKFDLIDYV